MHRLEHEEEVVMGSVESVREVVGPALTSRGLELWDVEITRDVVRILVDRPGGIDLDALTQASGVISPLLDQNPVLAPGGRYQLEVSSPGIERTLRTPDQFRRYLGSEITVKTSVPVSGARRHRGTLVAADDGTIRLQPTDAPDGAVVELRHDQIDRARTILVWGPTPPAAGKRPGKRPARATTATAAPDAKDPES
jgi:ribosome maturation factor RimP